MRLNRTPRPRCDELQDNQSRAKCDRPSISGRRRTSCGRLGLLAIATFATLCSSSATAENRLTISGDYYRERSTRVLAPQLHFTVDAPDERLVLGARYLLDTVSSASIATGTADATGGDNVFTELRHEVTMTADSNVKGWQPGAFFRYSTETDYISRSLGFGLGRDFLERTLNLRLTYTYNFDRVYRISGAAGSRLPWCGGYYGRTCDAHPGGSNLLETHYVAASYTHVVHKTVLLLATFEYAHLAGPQDNPYRGMLIPNAQVEVHPLERNRYAIWAGPRWNIPRLKMVVEPRYRFSIDDWGLLTNMLDARAHFRVAPHARMRLRYRYYHQSKAGFFQDDFNYESFDADVQCEPDAVAGCASADPKLDSFSSHTPGIQLTFELDGLAARHGWSWLEGAWIQATYNYVFQNSRFQAARALGSLAFSVAF